MAHDLDLFVIGAGSAGVRAARFAANFGARVAVAEDRDLGGTCVNLGCVPKKMFVYGASYADDFAQAASYGWSVDDPAFEWSTLLANKNREIARLNGIYDSILQKAGARLIRGRARIVGPHAVEVAGERVTADNILVATGCRPLRPDIPGAELGIVSDDVFHLPELPRRALVVGGGYIAVELASVFRGLGVDVVQIYRRELFMRGFDDGIREHLRDQLRLKGLDLRFNTDLTRIERQNDGALLAHLNTGETLTTDCVLFATGRGPTETDLGLDTTRATRDAHGFVEVDDHYRTAEPSIYAVGDLIGRAQLTPVALAEGMAVARHLFRPSEYAPVDYELIPTAVFSLPNVGTVGLGEQDAVRRGHRIEVYESRFKPLKLTLTDAKESCLLKLVVDADDNRVLGAHMVGADAGEIIQGLAVALKAGATKRQFDETIAIHPTTAEEFVTMRQPRA
ncbi:glutathione-disulfide reductase [Solimonas marina]|uniref:Glutathione-disulfide reductase n=1 Tax=Solimonas marina TaxID=2714601 RepID=A0A969WE34_9GAMM|nr:glutathione-disulfide reductase [Solimonas marina]NKF23085.1 glutathione-disulfide reductase [Solimonas marina]